MSKLNNIFMLRDAGDETMTPQQFGYWSVSWAHDNAIAELNSLLGNQKNRAFEFVNSIRKIQFPAYLQFLSLCTASYWAYAVLILRVPAPLIKGMGLGMDDALKNLGNSDGKPLDEDLKMIIKKSFGAYYSAITSDFHNPRDPRAVNLDVNDVAKNGVHNFSQFYPVLQKKGTNPASDAQVAVEQVFLSHLIADIPHNLFLALKNDLGLTFRA